MVVFLLPLVQSCCDAGAASQEVHYETPDGFRVSALLYRPEGPCSAAIVILPDQNEGKEAWGAVAESLRQTGFHVLTPDLRGTGQSLYQRGIRRDRIRFTQLERAACRLDAEAAIRYLGKLPDPPIRSVALVASGASAAILANARAEGLLRVCYALVSPSVAGAETGWTDTIGEPSGGFLVLVAAKDLIGMDAAAAIVPDGSARECWIVAGSGRGAELLASRPDLVRPWMEWIESALSGGSP